MIFKTTPNLEMSDFDFLRLGIQDPLVSGTSVDFTIKKFVQAQPDRRYAIGIVDSDRDTYLKTVAHVIDIEYLEQVAFFEFWDLDKFMANLRGVLPEYNHPRIFVPNEEDMHYFQRRGIRCSTHEAVGLDVFTLMSFYDHRHSVVIHDETLLENLERNFNEMAISLNGTLEVEPFQSDMGTYLFSIHAVVSESSRIK